LVSGIVDIKVYILFILRRLGGPEGLEALYALATRDGAVSYFDFTDCLNGLVKTGHVSLEAGKYAITGKGAENLATTENGLPYSLRIKADRSVRAYRAQRERGTMVRASRSMRRTGGYTVNMSLSDGEAELMSLHIYADSESDAVALESGYLERAERVYGAVLDSILGDKAGGESGETV
jgi:hypothetical protein